MKIGLFFDEPRPQGGGVFTFQQDVFQAFLKLAPKSEHEFVILCSPRNIQAFRDMALPANVIAAPIRESRRWRSLRLRTLSALGLPEHWGASRAKARALEQCGAQFSWSMGHFEHEAFDTPYLTTVFDLQHRLQPWFPEVSRGGTWDNRERYFHRYISRATFVVTGTQVGRLHVEQFYRLMPGIARVVPFPTPSFALEAPYLPPDQALTRLGLVDDYLFYPAQFWPHKNHATLLRALKILNSTRTTPLHLALVGSDKGNLNYIRTLAKSLRLTSHVHFLGFVDQPDLIALYRGAKCMVYPSLFGPDNLPPLEAFALACPVVISEYDGAREQLGDSALYFNGTDPEQLSDRISEVLKSEVLRASLVQNGLARAKAWTSLAYVRAVFELFDEFQATRGNWV